MLVGMDTTTPESPKRACIYSRVSQDQSGEGASVDQQEDLGRRVIQQRGWTLLEPDHVFTDNSITGTGKKHRPKFYAMLDAVRRGEVDVIVARHLDRLSRGGRERLELVELCRKHNVLISLVMGSDMDPSTASGRAMIGLLGEIA